MAVLVRQPDVIDPELTFNIAANERKELARIEKLVADAIGGDVERGDNDCVKRSV